MPKIKVLIVDDSALVRQTMLNILTEANGFESIVAYNAILAQKKIEQRRPDVIVLDIEMPQMDGITYLKKIMSEDPIPVVICSALTSDGSRKALEALDAGAVEVINKPQVGTKKFLEESSTLLIDSVKAAYNAQVSKKRKPAVTLKVAPKLNADVMLSIGKPSLAAAGQQVIVVGASTGGTQALEELLKCLPDNMPPICIVQHMPENFTKAFATRLNSICKINVCEAKNGDVLKSGMAMIAPGNYHMLLKRRGKGYYVDVKDGPLVSRHRPSVDVLFRSAARFAGGNVIGVIMTGMGDDGAQGMLEMKNAGAITIAQNEQSCIVYGMPKEAVKRNCVDHIVALDQIAPLLIQLSEKK